MSTNFDELYDDAVRLYASGYDNDYIRSDFAEKNIDHETTEAVIKKIKTLRKAGKRRVGVKLMIGGLAAVLAGVAFTYFSFNSGSPVVYVLYGLIIAGFMTFAKGLVDMI
ncbi:MAG: hypothetical protein K0S32_3346 [Bacteroidetes bacterium]|jgi:hypothetical protein|nr:hypothetical protein [Bacteroidota bacterium]